MLVTVQTDTGLIIEVHDDTEGYYCILKGNAQRGGQVRLFPSEFGDLVEALAKADVIMAGLIDNRTAG